jgi:glucokinase
LLWHPARYRSHLLGHERVIGVDVGGTKILAGVVARDGTIGRKIEVATPTTSQPDLVVALERLIEELLEDGVAGLGFGLPSQIDQRLGVAIGSVNIPLDHLPLRDHMLGRFGLPTAIENDANAATLAEWKLGAGRGVEDVVMLTLGTGVGGGVVIDGHLFRGWAELGHVVIDYDGPPCFGTCSGRGHLEALCSGQAADVAARKVLGPAARAHELVAQARKGDERSLEALAEIARYLGAGIGSFANIFDPSVVIIGGGFGVAAFDLLVGPAREIVRREALPPADEAVEIVLAELGSQAGLLGAGLVAFETLDG